MLNYNVRINRTKEGNIIGLSIQRIEGRKIHKGVIRLTSVENELGVYKRKETVIGEDGKEKPTVSFIAAKAKTIESLKNTRVQNGQLVVTPEGFGTIKDYTPTQGNDSINVPYNLCIQPIKKFKTARFNKINEIWFIDIVDDKTGIKYPAIESDYYTLFYDNAKVEFTVSKKGKAVITAKSRRMLSKCRPFALKQNGIKIFNELIKQGWNPIK